MIANSSLSFENSDYIDLSRYDWDTVRCHQVNLLDETY